MTTTLPAIPEITPAPAIHIEPPGPEEILRLRRLRFIEALEGGTYTQARGILYRDDGEGKGAYCAAGVGLDLLKPDHFSLPAAWGAHFNVAYGTNLGFLATVIRLNDEVGYSFPQIADFLRKQWNLPVDHLGDASG